MSVRANSCSFCRFVHFSPLWPDSLSTWYHFSDRAKAGLEEEMQSIAKIRFSVGEIERLHKSRAAPYGTQHSETTEKLQEPHHLQQANNKKTWKSEEKTLIDWFLFDSFRYFFFIFFFCSFGSCATNVITKMHSIIQKVKNSMLFSAQLLFFLFFFFFVSIIDILHTCMLIQKGSAKSRHDWKIKKIIYCKRRNFRRRKISCFPSKTFRMEFIFRTQYDKKKKKQNKRWSSARQVEENLVSKRIPYLFQLYESYEMKFPTNFSIFCYSKYFLEVRANSGSEHRDPL